MSAVTIAVLAGFVCCALVIRVLGSRTQVRRPKAVVVEGDRSVAHERAGAFYA
jgi:hypothetical protein